MFCSQCGAFIGADSQFCPSCGVRIEGSEAAQPETGNYAFSGIPASSGGKKKRIKKKAKVLISLLLAVSIIAGGIFIAPGIVLKGNSIDNVFYLAAMKIGKDHENYPLMTALASVYNTLFNSHSLTLEFSEWDEKLFDMKIQLGMNISSSKLYIDVGDGNYGAFSDGRFVVIDDDSALEVDVGNITSSESGIFAEIGNLLISRDEEDIRNYEAIKSTPGISEEAKKNAEESIERESKSIEMYKEFFGPGNSGDKAIKNLISNNKLQIKNILGIIEYYFGVLEKAKKKYPEIYENNEGSEQPVYDLLSADTGKVSSAKVLDAFVEIIANADYSKALKVKDSSKGSGRNAEVKYNISGNIAKLLECLVEEVDEASELRKIYGDDVIESFCENMNDWIDFYFGDTDDSYWEFGLTVKTSGSYVSELIFKDEDGDAVFELNISDVNKTKVTREEIERVNKKYKKCDDVEYLGEAGDIFIVY